MKRLYILFLLTPFLMVSQHQIKGSFSPAEKFTYAFLYQATPTTLDFLGRAKVDSLGNFQIPLSSPAGMYKIVYGLPQDQNNFDLIYNGKEDIALTFSMDEGLIFTESSENKLWMSYTNSMELINSTISNFYEKESEDRKAYADIFKTLKETQTSFEQAAEGTIALTFIKANRPYIPTEYEDLKTYSGNVKQHYLKNIDFKNPLLQSSDFLSDRILAYVFALNLKGDSITYKNNIDNVALALNEVSDGVKISLMTILWQHFEMAEQDEIANYLADKYLLPLAEKTNNQGLKNALLEHRRASIGAIAEDFPITYTVDGVAKNTSLHELNSSEHYLVVFWSSTCSHCLQELPALKKFIETHPKDLTVVAFGVESDTSPWETTIGLFPNFIHVIGMESWDNPIVKNYGVQATPSYYILDKEKNIIAKPKTLNSLEEYLKEMK